MDAVPSPNDMLAPLDAAPKRKRSNNAFTKKKKSRGRRGKWSQDQIAPVLFAWEQAITASTDRSTQKAIQDDAYGRFCAACPQLEKNVSKNAFITAWRNWITLEREPASMSDQEREKLDDIRAAFGTKNARFANIVPIREPCSGCAVRCLSLCLYRL